MKINFQLKKLQIFQIFVYILPGPAVIVQSTGCMVGPKFIEEDDFLVRCPCGVNQDDGLMILCDLCSNWQHAVSTILRRVTYELFLAVSLTMLTSPFFTHFAVCLSSYVINYLVE